MQLHVLITRCGCGWIYCLGVGHADYFDCYFLHVLGGCAAGAPEVRARLGQEYVGKNVDALVVQWGPPTSMFRMNSGGGSYVWQLSSVTDIHMRNGSGSASTYACKVSVITSPAGIVTQLDTEDYNPGGTGLLGLAGALGAYGSMCGQRLGMKPQS
jgi:hypothetical protein